MKKAQITVFIIIGLIILILIGTFLYMTRTQTTAEFEKARPRIGKVPEFVQPLRDYVQSCVNLLAKDGLKKIGDQGGYIDTNSLIINPMVPTDGEAIKFSNRNGPAIAYWWHMSSPNNCENNCDFESERPGLMRNERGNNIEVQLDEYIESNLKSCIGTFESIKKQGCTVQELALPDVTSTIAEDDVFFTASYPIRITCDEQVYDLEEYYVNIDLNFREIYALATNITNTEIQMRFLESVTSTVLNTYGGLESGQLPPIRDLKVGPPQPGKYWLRSQVEEQLSLLLTSHISLIQTSSVRNYHTATPSPDTRDPELFSNIYNRQFFLPLLEAHPDLEVRFRYLDWWKPYLDLNCGGEVCQGDSGSNFFSLPLTLNRYQFAYDISYPVLVEIRNPFAFNDEGYSFKFFLEQNLRDSQAFTSDTKLLSPEKTTRERSMFCDPAQRLSGNITLAVQDEITRKYLDGASVSYLCGDQTCNLGRTKDGTFIGPFPRCVGGALRVSQPGYAAHTALLDIAGTEEYSLPVAMQPEVTLNARVKNFVLTKTSKHGQWEYHSGMPLRPPENLSTLIQLKRIGGPYDEPYFSITQLEGDEDGTIKLIPGKYLFTANAMYKGQLVIPADRRCTKPSKILGITIVDKECFFVPESPVYFNETTPFPYGSGEVTFTIKPEDLRAKNTIEFRQFVMNIDKIPAENRIIEDLNTIRKVIMYAEANKARLKPVIT